MDRSATATSLLALALGLLGALLLTVIPLAVGYAARGSPLPAVAVLALAVGGGVIWRRLTRQQAAAAPPAPRRIPSHPSQAEAALLALPEFTLLEAQQATGLDMARLEPLLDTLLARRELRAETHGEAVVYVRVSRSAS